MGKILKNRTEFFLSLYLVLFSLLRCLTVSYKENSTKILAIATTILILIWITTDIIYERKLLINCKAIFFVISIYFIICMDILIRNNSLKMNYIYNFTIYGAIPIILVSRVKDYDKLLLYYSILTVLNGFLYLYDPINSYKFTGDYMGFGFNQMLPAFAGSLILHGVFKKKCSIIFMAVFFAEMLIFANKGATICALFMILIYYIFLNRNNITKYKKTIILLIIFLIVILNLDKIIAILIKMIRNFNISTYSLNTFLKMMEGNGEAIYSSRISIWKDAIYLFVQKPLLGYGFGYFELIYNGYTHNLFLDIAVSSGLVGLTLFFVVLIYSVIKMIKTKEYNKKVFLVIMMTISFVPLMISLSYWTVISFWVYWGIILCSKNKV